LQEFSISTSVLSAEKAAGRFMKQLVQLINSGESRVMEVPVPGARPGSVVIQLSASLLSAGTERTVVEFAEKSLVQKARARPDLVRQTLDKARREGILQTIDAVRNRLDQPMALGYSAAGTLVEVGEGVSGFQRGDRVAVAGGGHAAHAEIVEVPVNLAVKIANAVSFDAAAFTTVAAVALQGVRLSGATLGERVAVIGLGLLGQLSVQLLHAAGCRVFGLDPNAGRARLGLRSGAVAVATSEADFVSLCETVTGGQGIDSVLITADTPSDQPVTLAGTIARDRAVVVAVGAVGLNVPRKIYYEKELDLRISRSYGPGRYDTHYEEHGYDYPIGYVRWTENRNMQAVADLLAEGRLDVAPLVTHRFDIDDGARAYELITGKTGESFLGVLLTYPPQVAVPSRRIDLGPHAAVAAGGAVGVGLIGAGNFATSTLLPAIRKEPGSALVGVCDATGLSARHAADRFKFGYCTTDNAEILADPAVSVIVITTRHHLHARQVVEALEAGKHVYVEKPLCLTRDELQRIDAAYHVANRLLMVGFNRRFAPMARQATQFFEESREPLVIHYRVNAGYLPATHWTQDPAEGGGRLLGEVVHFIDLAMWLAGAPPVTVSAVGPPGGGRYQDDNLAITVTFANGAVGQILYLANGSRLAGKERLEVHGGGRTAILDDFRSLVLADSRSRHVSRSRFRQDKGHAAEWSAFARAIRDGGPSPIPFNGIRAVMETAFCALDSLAAGAPVRITTGRVEPA
jgi:predicted dehydrogenase/threonine dehydrogenase-like Zn-dependent dehydrogenase